MHTVPATSRRARGDAPTGGILPRVSTEASRPPGWARTAFAVNAVVAWTGVVLVLVVSGLGWFAEGPSEPGLYGSTTKGAAGRVVDSLSYFTIWSNIVVALSVTSLALDPARDTLLRRVLRLDGLLMITVTAVVYQLLLAPSMDIVGWSRLTDPIVHVITPVLTLLVWLVVGPRGWITWRLAPLALLIPLAWIVWMLGRGAVIDAYPYGFTNVTELGYGSVLVTLALVLVFALVVTLLLWGLDLALRRRGRQDSRQT